MKKILFLAAPLKFFLMHKLPLALAAKEAGYEVHIASPIEDERDRGFLEGYGLIAHDLPLCREKKTLWAETKNLWYVFRMYRRVKPEIVHQITVRLILFGTLSARLSGIKYIVNAFSGLGYVFTASGRKAAMRRNIIEYAFRLVMRHKNHMAIFENGCDADYMQKQGIVRPNEVQVIKGSGIDLDIFEFVAEPEGTPIVICPARMLRDKGIVEFVAAARLLKERGVSVRMVLAGDTDYGNPTAISEQMLQEWENSGAIEYWGFRQDMADILRNSNIVCLPSYREGLSKALLEAAASGRAIVTTDVPGCRDVISEQFPNGLLVPAYESEALADAIQRLLDDPAFREELGRNGRKLAEREFSVALVQEKTMELYERLAQA